MTAQTNECIFCFFDNQECLNPCLQVRWETNSLYIDGELAAIIDRESRNIVIDTRNPAIESAALSKVSYVANRRGYKIYKEDLRG